MAANYNKVLLMGNLTRDIELRHLPSGQAVAQVGIAVNRRWKTETGEQKEETTFVDCEAWGKTAEIMSQYLQKGRPVFIEGRLKLDTWQDKNDGSNRSKLKVVVEEFRFIDSKGGDGGGGGGGGEGGGYSGQRSGAPRAAGGGRPAPAGGKPKPEAPVQQIDEDDIPF
jgi:single-strand DNA-binding protein